MIQFVQTYESGYDKLFGFAVAANVSNTGCNRSIRIADWVSAMGRDRPWKMRQGLMLRLL